METVSEKYHINGQLKNVLYKTKCKSYIIERKIKRKEWFTVSRYSLNPNMDLEEAKAEFEKYPFHDITENECQERIDKLGFVCGGCGEKPTPIETVNNSDEPTFWAGCNQCGRFNTGVPLAVFKTANIKYDNGSRWEYATEKHEHLLSISSDVWSVIRDYEKAENESTLEPEELAAELLKLKESKAYVIYKDVEKAINLLIDFLKSE